MCGSCRRRFGFSSIAPFFGTLPLVGEPWIHIICQRRSTKRFHGRIRERSPFNFRQIQLVKRALSANLTATNQSQITERIALCLWRGATAIEPLSGNRAAGQEPAACPRGRRTVHPRQGYGESSRMDGVLSSLADSDPDQDREDQWHIVNRPVRKTSRKRIPRRIVEQNCTGGVLGFDD